MEGGGGGWDCVSQIKNMLRVTRKYPCKAAFGPVMPIVWYRVWFLDVLLCYQVKTLKTSPLL